MFSTAMTTSGVIFHKVVPTHEPSKHKLIAYRIHHNNLAFRDYNKLAGPNTWQLFASSEDHYMHPLNDTLSYVVSKQLIRISGR